MPTLTLNLTERQLARLARLAKRRGQMYSVLAARLLNGAVERGLEAEKQRGLPSYVPEEPSRLEA